MTPDHLDEIRELTQHASVATKVIWMDAWEFECCAEEFEVGSGVTWMLAVADQAFKARLTALLGEVEGSRLTHYETHHGPRDDPLAYVAGTAVAIKKVFRSHDARTRPVEGSYYAEHRVSAVKFEDEERDGAPKFRGYLIDVETS